MKMEPCFDLPDLPDGHTRPAPFKSPSLGLYTSPEVTRVSRDSVTQCRCFNLRYLVTFSPIGWVRSTFPLTHAPNPTLFTPYFLFPTHNALSLHCSPHHMPPVYANIRLFLSLPCSNGPGGRASVATALRRPLLALPLTTAAAAAWPRDVSHRIARASSVVRVATPSTPTSPSAPSTSTSGSISFPSTFKDLPGVHPYLVQRLAEQRITYPTPIQEKSFPHILANRDVGLRSFTGSGKTLAFLLPLLSHVLPDLNLDLEEEDLTEANNTSTKRNQEQKQHPIGTADNNRIRILVIVPSQELGMQTVRVARSLLPSRHAKSVQQCIGGANIHRQIEALRQNRPFLVVGTPGRLAELDQSGKLGLHRIAHVVVDEADQLLADNFRRDMTRIMTHAGRKVPELGRQTIAVSATLAPEGLRRLAVRWILPGRAPPALVAPRAPHPAGREAGSPSLSFSPTRDGVGRDENALEQSESGSAFEEDGWEAAEGGWNKELGVFTESSAGGRYSEGMMGDLPQGLVHKYMVVPRQRKLDAARRLIHASHSERVLIFLNYGRRLADAQAKLAARGLAVGSLHGELRKEERARTLTLFREGKLRVLLVSDVAARGLDIPGVGCVINLELPSNAPHYVHRAGRAGRAGKEGIVVTLAEPREAHVVAKMAAGLSCALEPCEVVGGEIVKT